MGDAVASVLAHLEAMFDRPARGDYALGGRGVMTATELILPRP